MVNAISRVETGKSGVLVEDEPPGKFCVLVEDEPPGKFIGLGRIGVYLEIPVFSFLRGLADSDWTVFDVLNDVTVFTSVKDTGNRPATGPSDEGMAKVVCVAVSEFTLPDCPTEEV